MADLNLMDGGLGRDVTSANNAGPYPTIYPAPTRVASHHKPQVFTVDKRFGPFRELSGNPLYPAVNHNQAYAVRATAPDLTTQTSALIGKKIGLQRIPARHLVTSMFVHAHGGTYGAGMTFDVFIDEVDSSTGALISSKTLPAALLGVVMGSAAVPTEAWAALSPTTGGLFTGSSTYEIGIKVLTVPAASGSWTGLVADLDGHINLLAKVEGFDIR